MQAALGHHDRAVLDFDEAIRLDPASAPAHFNRGFAHLVGGRQPLHQPRGRSGGRIQRRPLQWLQRIDRTAHGLQLRAERSHGQELEVRLMRRREVRREDPQAHVVIGSELAERPDGCSLGQLQLRVPGVGDRITHGSGHVDHQEHAGTLSKLRPRSLDQVQNLGRRW